MPLKMQRFSLVPLFSGAHLCLRRGRVYAREAPASLPLVEQKVFVLDDGHCFLFFEKREGEEESVGFSSSTLFFLSLCPPSSPPPFLSLSRSLALSLSSEQSCSRRQSLQCPSPLSLLLLSSSLLCSERLRPRFQLSPFFDPVLPLPPPTPRLSRLRFSLFALCFSVFLLLFTMVRP